jgi:hypothetical protein
VDLAFEREGQTEEREDGDTMENLGWSDKLLRDGCEPHHAMVWLPLASLASDYIDFLPNA